MVFEIYAKKKNIKNIKMVLGLWNLCFSKIVIFPQLKLQVATLEK